MKKLILKSNLTFLLVFTIFFSAVSIADENDVEKVQQSLKEVHKAKELKKKIIFLEPLKLEIHEEAAKAYIFFLD